MAAALRLVANIMPVSHRTNWTGLNRHDLVDLVHPPPIGERSIVMSASVCVCLSVHDHTFGTTRPIFSEFLVHVTHGRGSVLLWRGRNELCTSGFMDDVIFAYKPRLLDVAVQLKRSAYAALGLAINCAQ